MLRFWRIAPSFHNSFATHTQAVHHYYYHFTFKLISIFIQDMSMHNVVAPLTQDHGNNGVKSSSSRVTMDGIPTPPPWVFFTAGGAGGMCGAIVTAPFDLVRTRLQSSLFASSSTNRMKGKGKEVVQAHRGRVGRLLYHFVDTGVILKGVYKEEGARALFRGLGPTLVGVIPSRSINFSTYGTMKPFLSSTLSLPTSHPAVHLLSAAAAGVATSTATNPIWVVKTRLQLQSQQLAGLASSTMAAHVSEGRIPPRLKGGPNQHFAPSFRTLTTAAVSAEHGIYVRSFRSSWECILHVFRTEGVLGFYRGLSASYLGVAEGTIQWTLYERGKIWAAKGAGKGEGEEGWLAQVGAAGGAKLIATMITYPHEVVRTRMRQSPPAAPAKTKYSTLASTIRHVWIEEGVSAFYNGLSPHLLRVVPNAAVMYSVYEAALSIARRRQRRRVERERGGGDDGATTWS